MSSRLSAWMILLMLVGFGSKLCGQEYHWQTYTNKENITSIKYYGGYAWATTTGGIVRIDLTNESSKSYINSDGSGSIYQNFSFYAGEGIAYFGSADGVLSQFVISSEDFTNYTLEGRDGTKLKLYGADTSAGYLWIATNVGVVKFDRNRHGGEVKETYRTLGDFPSEMQINDVAVFDGKIYAGGTEGLAYGDDQSDFLLDPSEWSNFALGDAASPDSVKALKVFNSKLYVGTTNGLYIVASDGTISARIHPGWQIYSFASATSALYAVANDGAGRKLFTITDTEANVVATGGVPEDMNCVAIAGLPILGTESSGVYRDGGEFYLKVDLPGPGNNNVVGGGIAGDGTLYVVNRTGNSTVSILKNGEWSQLKFVSNERLAGLLDKQGDLWVGTFGAGVYRYRSDGTLQHFISTNSPLNGVSEDTTFTVVNDIYEDPGGRLWFSCYRGSPLRPLVMFDPSDSIWTYFDSKDSVTSDRSQAVAVGDGFVALGFEVDQGVALIEFGDSPFDHRDDQIHYYGRAYNLQSNIVNAMTVDRDNRLWVGTPLGLSHFEPDYGFFFRSDSLNGASSDIRALTTDSRNNLWVGTANGLALIAGGTTKSAVFNTENSEIVADEIQSLTFDSKSGKLLVFTTGGLSVLDYNLSPADSSSAVYPYPNPFVVIQGIDARLQFKINKRADVRIYTVAGELVRKTDVNSGWDGKNDAGQLVASGVYIYYLESEDKAHYTGKIFVLRK